MGRGLAALVLASALGCGRIAFDARGAGGDGANGDDAPRGPFCASLAAQPSFCSDFMAGSAGWTGDEQINAIYAVEPSGGPDGLSGALVISTPTLGSGNASEASLYWGQTTLPTSSVTVSFDVRIDTQGTSLPVLGLVVFDGTTSSHGVEYAYATPPGPSQLEENVVPDVGSSTFFYDPMPTFPAQEWHRIEYTIAIGTTWTAALSIDGGTPTVATLMDTTNGQPGFAVGVPYLNGPAAPWQIRVSNVIVDVQ